MSFLTVQLLSAQRGLHLPFICKIKPHTLCLHVLLSFSTSLLMLHYLGIKQYKIMLPVEVIVPDWFFPVQYFSFDSLCTLLCFADLNWITNEKIKIYFLFKYKAQNHWILVTRQISLIWKICSKLNDYNLKGKQHYFPQDLDFPLHSY